jgi:hypothetical protein
MLSGPRRPAVRRGRDGLPGLAGWRWLSRLLGLAVLPGVAVLPGLTGTGRATAPAAAPASGLAGAVRTAEQPVLQAIGLPTAWRLSRGKGVKVGVLDTGVGTGAPDLAGSVTFGPDYTIGVDPPGYQPPHLHGTYISSLIAGHGSGPGQSGGVIGVAPAAKVLSVRVLPDDQEPGLRVYNDSPRYADAIGRGIRYAVRHGVSVINMSLGSSSPDRGLRAAVAYAISHGVVVVAAAGNSGSGTSRFTPYSYPASYPGVIAVAAVSSQGSRASFSDHNASVVVSAPGVSVVGAAPAGHYLQASGTSPASALVAGVATLIRSAYPRLPPALVAQALITSTRHRPQHGYSPNVGFGEVNAAGALQAARRLAGQQPARGVSPAARAGGAPGPVQVVHRDAARIFGYGGVSAAAALGFLAALVALAVLSRRARRDRRAYRAGPPGGGAPLAGHAPGPAPAPPGPGYPGYGYPGPVPGGPGYGQPGSGPGYGYPGPGSPGTGSPGAGQPGAGAGYGYPGSGPGYGYPGPGSPGTGSPGAGHPGHGYPGSGPGYGYPETGNPGIGSPAAGQGYGSPGTGQPGGGYPGYGYPESGPGDQGYGYPDPDPPAGPPGDDASR